MKKQIGKRNYTVIERKLTETNYPGFYKHGVVALLTLQYGNTVYTASERKGGKIDKPRKAFGC